MTRKENTLIRSKGEGKGQDLKQEAKDSSNGRRDPRGDYLPTDDRNRRKRVPQGREGVLLPMVA